MKFFGLLSFLMLLSCATMSPEALKIQLHSQMSSLLSSCEKKGPLTAVVSKWGQWSGDTAKENAKIKLREQAYALGADTAVILNIDELTTEVVAQGTALKCHNK